MKVSTIFTPVSYSKIFALSLPVIAANIALPIQGLIDVAIIGHLDSPNYLSAVGLATQLFALLFVSFNFLQYASSGLSAQAIGKGDTKKLKRVLLRALILAAAIGLSLIILQWFWVRLGGWFFDVSEKVRPLFSRYYAVRIWGAPIELANYAFIGWFAGQGRPGALLRQQLLVSVSNILLNLLFVVGLGWHVVGVALGTLLAQMLGFFYALWLVKSTLKLYAEPLLPIDWQRLLKWDELSKLMQLNRDIMIRTVILTLSFAWVTRLSSQQGELLLAANVILLQLLSLSSYAIDGIAVTTESLVGQAYGKQHTAQLNHVVARTTIAAVFTAGLISLFFLFIKPLYIAQMTNIAPVAHLVSEYYCFAALIPFISVVAYQFDGVMFGMTANAIIRNSMVLVALLLFPLSLLLPQWWGNAGVWLSLYWFFILRGGILVWQFLRLRRQGGFGV